MSYLGIALALATCSLLLAEKNQVDVDTERPAVTIKKTVGNEKTVGASAENNSFRAAEDRNTIGNAKTVGGDGNVPYFDENDGVGVVGNSKTVGGR